MDVSEMTAERLKVGAHAILEPGHNLWVFPHYANIIFKYHRLNQVLRIDCEKDANDTYAAVNMSAGPSKVITGYL